MAYTFTEDNGSSYFATASASCSTNFDLFDLGLSYHDAEISDASASHGSTSTDTSYLDNLSLESANWERDFFATCADVFPSITSTISPFSSSNRNTGTSTSLAPKSQRLVHRMRPEGIAISNAQLLALENKDTTPLTAFRHPLHNSPPSTPPRTPQGHRTQPTTPSLTHSRRMHRIEKKSGYMQSMSKPVQYRSGSPHVMSSAQIYHHHQQQTPVLSPSFAEWTDRLRRLAMQSPQISHVHPISPPPSTKLHQYKRAVPSTTHGLTLGHGLGLDISDDIFGLSSSTTTDSSLGSKPSADDIFSSEPATSPWELDAGIELFGIKQDSWDYSSPDIHHATISSLDIDALESLPQSHYSGIVDTNFNGSSNGGLGICFANSNFSNSQAFDSLIEKSETPCPSSVKLPAMPFNTPVSTFGSPALCNAMPILDNNNNTTVSLIGSSIHPSPLPIPTTSTTPTRKSHSTPTTPKHRRTKSNTPGLTRSSHRSSSSSSNSKARHPRTSKSGSAGGLGFVNFTPEDRNRILTGVAPSGSSKTKARREKEALDRRRKLSEAARRLVGEAGGDVEAVDRELSD